MIAHRIKLCVFLLAAFTQALRPEDAPRNVVAANVGVITFQIDTGIVYERLLMPHWSLDTEVGFRSVFKDNIDGAQTRYIDETAMLIVCNKYRQSESLTGLYFGLCPVVFLDYWSFGNSDHSVTGNTKFIGFAIGQVVGYSVCKDHVFLNAGLEILFSGMKKLSYAVPDFGLVSEYTIHPLWHSRLIIAVGYAF